MSTHAAGGPTPMGPADQLRYAREIIQLEGQTLTTMAARLDKHFCRAVDILYGCQGLVITSGMGKAGDIGRKITGTLTSTGTRSVFLDPAGAVHGDLGIVRKDDVVLIFSQSGETEEVVRLLPSLEQVGAPIIAVTKSSTSTLGRAAKETIELGPLQEACTLGLAPSTSTTAMAALGDALALVTSRMWEFNSEDFARFHPGGSLGQQLSKVDDHMRPLEVCRVAYEGKTVREVFVEQSVPGRRSGAILLTDRKGILTGIFTDSDLARLFESRQDESLDKPIQNVMTAQPCRVGLGSMIVDVIHIMAERKISELPVVDASGTAVGLVDITDVVGIFPDETAARPEQPAHFRVVPKPPRAVPKPKLLQFPKQQQDQQRT